MSAARFNEAPIPSGIHFSHNSSEEVKYRQVSCVCYEKCCNGHELCSFKFPSDSEKSKQSCSKESKQNSTQDPYQDSRGKSVTNGRHQTEKHITDACSNVVI
jgi:hypothetical protein